MRLIALALFAQACTLLTSAEEYGIAPVPAARACAVCTDPALRRAPCPLSGAPDGEGEPIFFAMASIDLGSSVSRSDPPYESGLDADCSAGPPMACRPRKVEWQPLPGGIDNALAAQVLAPLERSESGSLQAGVSSWLRKGVGGLLLVVSRWNGQPDDASVTARLLAIAHREPREAPKFSREDRWVVYADGQDEDGLPQTRAQTASAFVRGGVLVADLRVAGEVVFRFGTQTAARVNLPLTHVVITGAMSRGAAGATLSRASIAGRYDVQRRVEGATEIAQALRGCEKARFCPLVPAVDALLRDAPDLPPAEREDAGGSCALASVGMAPTFVETGGVTGTVPLADLPARSCPGVTSCP
jgi:hypothetical protein